MKDTEFKMRLSKIEKYTLRRLSKENNMSMSEFLLFCVMQYISNKEKDTL